jgi:enamine deaminase RidA (YjgF/YER057c/UK114 family)
LEYKESHGINYSVFEDEAGKMLWGFGTSTNQPELSFREQAYSAFELLHALLSAEGYSMDDLVRQWNYIPDILKTITENSRTYQHYQLFNDIRQYYYGMYKQKAAYPAATGIGMDFGPVTIDFCAIQKKDSTRIIDLSNPNQMNAYCYGQDVLAGSPSRENERKKAPLFERAKYIDAENGNGWAFISGTASICGENTAGLNDIVTQTLITMDNIECLTSMDNLNIKPVSAMMKKYSYFRVYVKDPNDISPVMELCRKQYPNTPILYVKADICRDNLLVEIEGEAFLSRIR